jgi:GT2 family glycosyltransferase
MNKPQLSIIMVHWNTHEMLAECVKSIFEFEQNLHYEIIVMDNASDFPIDNLERNIDKPNITFIRLKENIGFGRATNFGVSQSTSDFLLFLGPDTRLFRKDTILRTLEKYKSISHAGAFSCSLINSDGSPQRHYFEFPRPEKILKDLWHETTNHISYVFKRRKKLPVKVLEPVDMVIAHWMMVSREAFEKAGGFPNDAFMFGDDIEINKRLKDVGYQNYVYRGECAYHVGGQSTNRRYQSKLAYIVYDSLFHFSIKHYGVFVTGILISMQILASLWYILVLSPFYYKMGIKSHISENWQVIWHYLAYQWRPGYIRKIRGG